MMASGSPCANRRRRRCSTLLPGGTASITRDLVGGPDHLVGQHHRRRGLVMAGQIVEQAGQLDRPGDLAVHHLGADPALADQQALVDQFLDGAAHGGPGQAELLGQADLVVQPVAGREIALVDGVLDLLGDLEVQRHRAGTIQVDEELGHRVLPARWCADGSTRQPDINMTICPIKVLTDRRRDGQSLITSRQRRRPDSFRPAPQAPRHSAAAPGDETEGPSVAEHFEVLTMGQGRRRPLSPAGQRGTGGRRHLQQVGRWQRRQCRDRRRQARSPGGVDLPHRTGRVRPVRAPGAAAR